MPSLSLHSLLWDLRTKYTS